MLRPTPGGPRNELGYVKKSLGYLSLRLSSWCSTPRTCLRLSRTPWCSGAPAVTQLVALWPLLIFSTDIKKPVYIPALQELYNQPGDRVKLNLEAIQQLHQLVRDQHGHLLVTITPLKRELDEGSTDKEKLARERLEIFLKEQSIPFLDFLPLFQRQDYQAFYSDRIHLTPGGNKFVSKVLSHFIYEHLPESSQPPTVSPEGMS